MDSQELRAKEERLKQDITKLLHDFEKETGATVFAIEVDSYDDEDHVAVYTS